MDKSGLTSPILSLVKLRRVSKRQHLTWRIAPSFFELETGGRDLYLSGLRLIEELQRVG